MKLAVSSNVLPPQDCQDGHGSLVEKQDQLYPQRPKRCCEKRICTSCHRRVQSPLPIDSRCSGPARISDTVKRRKKKKKISDYQIIFKYLNFWEKRVRKKGTHLESWEHPSAGFGYDHLGPKLMKLFPERSSLQCYSDGGKSRMKRPFWCRILRCRIRGTRRSLVCIVIVIVPRFTRWRRRYRRRCLSQRSFQRRTSGTFHSSGGLKTGCN